MKTVGPNSEYDRVEKAALQFSEISMLGIRLSLMCLGVLAFANCGKELPVSIPNPQADELYVKMSRGGCYGRCPIYELEINSDGNVNFDGKFFTKVNGTATDKISIEQLNAIVAAIRTSDFFNFEDSYEGGSGNCPSLATDLPQVELQIKLGEKEKSVKHYLGCFEEIDANEHKSWEERVYPHKLFELENKIDELAGSDKWAKEDEIR